MQWWYYLIDTFRYFRAILIFAILLCRNIFLKTKLFFQSGPHPARGVSSVFLSEKENKEALSELCQTFEIAQLQLLDLSILFCIWSNLFYECEHPFVDNPMVITEPAEPSARLLRLGSKRDPSNKRHLLKNDFTRFTQSLSLIRKIETKGRKCSASRVSGPLNLIRSKGINQGSYKPTCK